MNLFAWFKPLMIWTVVVSMVFTAETIGLRADDRAGSAPGTGTESSAPPKDNGNKKKKSSGKKSGSKKKSSSKKSGDNKKKSSGKKNGGKKAKQAGKKDKGKKDKQAGKKDKGKKDKQAGKKDKGSKKDKQAGKKDKGKKDKQAGKDKGKKDKQAGKKDRGKKDKQAGKKDKGKKDKQAGKKDKGKKDKQAGKKDRGKKDKQAGKKDKGKKDKQAGKKDRDAGKRDKNADNKQRRRDQNLSKQNRELHDQLRRKNQQLARDGRRDANLKANLRGQRARADRLQRDRLRDRSAIAGLRNQNASLGARAALDRSLAGQPLTADNRQALGDFRNQLINNGNLTSANRLRWLNVLQSVFWQDRLLANGAAFASAFTNIVPGVVVNPAVNGAAPPALVPGVLPSYPSYVVPAAPAINGVPEGEGLVQVVPELAADENLPAEDAEAAALTDDGGSVPQKTRYFRVVNAADKPLRVFIRYQTEIGDGKNKWYPGERGNPLTLELAPGEDVEIFDNDWRVNASQVYVWAECEGRKWSQFKDKSLWLVPEVDAAGKHIYLAPVRDVFTYTFK